jgi:cell wall-associated NlpC family hydrolase
VRRFLLFLTAALATAGPAHAATLGNWDRAQQREVVRAGLMHNPGGSFAGAAALSGADANAAMAALGGATVAQVAAAGPVTVTGFDRLLVDQLGLAAVAAHVQAATAAAGLRPPAYYGTEVVARVLGLRYDHPAGTDQLELYPYDRITRAEAAWSLSRVLGFGGWEVADARQTLAAFQLPPLTGAQQEALRIAVSRIGYPYVWGGTTDDTSDGLAHGGFDCSGFVWRVFKLSGLPWGREIGGRTAAQMAGEIPRSQRLRIRQLRSGDVLFFGSAHFNSTATEQNVIHAGIYMGHNWVINSSGQGVYVLPLKGSWLGDSFAWGRHLIRQS